MKKLLSKAKLEKDKVKELPFKQKLRYFSDYYKYPLLLLIIVVTAIILLIRSYINNGYKTYFNITLANATISDESCDNFIADLSKKYGIDGNRTRITVNRNNYTTSTDPEINYTTYDKLITNFYAKNIDVFIGNAEDTEYFANSRYLMNVKDYLSEEVYEKLLNEDKILFVKKTDTDDNELPILVDVPVGIKIKSSKVLNEAGFIIDEPVVSLATGSEHKKNAVKFIEYLLEE